MNEGSRRDGGPQSRRRAGARRLCNQSHSSTALSRTTNPNNDLPRGSAGRRGRLSCFFLLAPNSVWRRQLLLLVRGTDSRRFHSITRRATLQTATRSWSRPSAASGASPERTDTGYWLAPWVGRASGQARSAKRGKLDKADTHRLWQGPCPVPNQ